MKKKWEKPQLKVIVRTTPEESVLTACKASSGFGTGGPGDFSWSNGCLKAEVLGTACFGAQDS